MALPVAPSFAAFDVTARTEARSVHSVLLDAMFAKSRYLEVMGAGVSTNQQQRHEWISLAAPAEFVTSTSTTNTTIDGSASLTVLEVSTADAAKLKPGSLLINVTRATPIGTYQRNEVLQVTAVSAANLVTVVRDIGAYNSGTGSTAHTDTDVFRIVHEPTQEGSLASADANTYSADSIFENYTQINTMKMQLTGSQKARAMEVVSSEVERQWQRELIALKNKRCNQFIYGTNSATAVGSDTVIRQSKGLLDFLVDNINSSNALIDYTTTALTYDSINALFIKLVTNGADPSENYKIVTSPVSADVISTWDSDKVVLDRTENTVGRQITMFKSSMGFTAEVVMDPMIMKSDLFIINPAKLFPATFRPYETQEWGKGTSAPNGDDMWYRRTIGEETLVCIDPGYAHAALTYLTWL